VDYLVTNNLLPFTSIIIEPAKVLFLNNAINHGVLTPLGSQEVLESGKSVLFLLEANPAAGLGLLLAYMFFGKGVARASAPSAAIIHFFGGIHEIYFPYVLMKPRLIAAMIAGGMTQIFVNVTFDTGLVAPAAPGSIFAVYAQTARGSYLGVTLSVILGAAASFLVAAVLLKTDRSEDGGDLDAATASMESMKGKKSIASSTLSSSAVAGREIRDIVFACDAGMGSSAMGASVLRKKVQAAGHGEVTVVNKAIANLKDDVDLVVTHQDLTDRARLKAPSAVHVSVDNFMASPRYDEIVEMLGASSGAAVVDEESDAAAGDVLARESIVLGGTARTRDEAIDEAGRLLLATGAIEASYIESMHEREQSVSTHMGNGLAIPHGTNEAKSAIHRSALSFVRYADGIDWNGKRADFVVGIAGAGDDHLALLRSLATVFADESQVARLRAATSPDEVLDVLHGVSV
jgi:PTS system mannitol-specific IIC component